jgi:predicted DCC family thiol-disulfide oxidoreductase YuxK
LVVEFFICQSISVNTEITDNTNKDRRDWVCYDADCAICVRWAARFRTLLERHGFALMPLQSPAVHATLPVSQEELLAEMRVITRDGHVFGGADALIYLSPVICKPLFALTRIPGIKPLLRTAYRFVARNRTCNTGVCVLRPTKLFRVGNPADWLPLLILVSAAAVVGKFFPPWLYMWAITFALFAGCKWLCFRRELANSTTAGFGRKVGFLFGWIGMDAAAFTSNEKTLEAPRTTEWLLAALKVCIGSALIWAGVRLALPLNPLLAGWTGMVGLILVLHFGLFHLLALTWQSAGVPVTPLMRAPLLARSLGDFWGERWNTAFNKLAFTLLFRPLHRSVGVCAATMLVFLVSGLVHDLVISVPARGGYGLPTLYFLLQGAGILFERTPFARRCGLNCGVRGWIFTMAITAGPVFWLFHPPFIRNVILPFLKTIGAT